LADQGPSSCRSRQPKEFRDDVLGRHLVGYVVDCPKDEPSPGSQNIDIALDLACDLINRSPTV
jgi:hypothetical protein